MSNIAATVSQTLRGKLIRKECSTASRAFILSVVGRVAAWIRGVRPQWVLTLDPDHGMYGHPEHGAAGEIVVSAARSTTADVHARVFAAENRFASLLPTNLDPGPSERLTNLRERDVRQGRAAP